MLPPRLPPEPDLRDLWAVIDAFREAPTEATDSARLAWADALLAVAQIAGARRRRLTGELAFEGGLTFLPTAFGLYDLQQGGSWIGLAATLLGLGGAFRAAGKLLARVEEERQLTLIARAAVRGLALLADPDLSP